MYVLQYVPSILLLLSVVWNNFGIFPNEKRSFGTIEITQTHQGGMGGYSVAQSTELEAVIEDLETQHHVSQNGLGDMYLALKRMLVGDGSKRTQKNDDVKKETSSAHAASRL